MYTKTLNWPSAVERVLEESDRPLSAIEIARYADRQGWIDVRVAQPSHSVKGAIQNHIKAGNRLGFLVIRRELGQEYLYWLIRKKLL